MGLEDCEAVGDAGCRLWVSPAWVVETLPPLQTGDQGQRGLEETQSLGLSAGVVVA